MTDRKTTVYLDSGSYRRLQELAAREGRPAAALIRLAVDELLEARRGWRPPRSIGAGTSGRGDLGERAEELLEGFGDDR